MTTQSLSQFNNVAIFGSHGAIGNAFVEHFLTLPIQSLYTFSRHPCSILDPRLNHFILDITDEGSIHSLATSFDSALKFDLILITTGLLHNSAISPEKTIRSLSQNTLRTYFDVNTIAPMLIAKSFIPFLSQSTPSIMAMLSARVGSITDNSLGGWYGYRASKAALNMMIKTVSIELRYTNKQAIVVGLHPGTVASNLSEPFTKNYSKNPIFTPNESVSHLTKVLSELSVDSSGNCFAWDGSQIDA
ncbi:hypothetical protein CL657_01785 [bacterium]|nr:hypothetical protein [bacterium]